MASGSEKTLCRDSTIQINSIHAPGPFKHYMQYHTLRITDRPTVLLPMIHCLGTKILKTQHARLTRRNWTTIVSQYRIVWWSKLLQLSSHCHLPLHSGDVLQSSPGAVWNVFIAKNLSSYINQQIRVHRANHMSKNGKTHINHTKKKQIASKNGHRAEERGRSDIWRFWSRTCRRFAWRIHDVSTLRFTRRFLCFKTARKAT